MNTIKTLENFESEYLFDAEWEADNYNRYIKVCKEKGREPNKEKTEFVKRYTEINPETGLAEICHTKIDQFINESACNEEFNHISYIKEAWEKSGFETEVFEFNQTTERSVQRKTAKSVKEILSDFETLDPKNQYIFHTDEDAEKLIKLKNKYPTLYNAYQKLTKEEIKSTDFNAREIEKLLILKNNKNAEIRVLKLLPLYFDVGGRYTKSYIKTVLQEIYDKSGFQKKATAEQLNNPKWYNAKECKIKNKDGKLENGFKILRMTFKLTVSSK